MTNTLTAILHKILVNSLPVLRGQSRMPRLVYNGYERAAAQKGDVINIPQPPSHTVSDVVPAAVSTEAAPQTPANIQLPIDQWKKSTPFGLNDKERAEIDQNEHFIPDNVAAAIEALARNVNQHIFANYVDIYGHVGATNASLFADKLPDVAAQAMRVLNDQLAPVSDRSFVISTIAHQWAVITPTLSSMDEVGESRARIEGVMGRKLGADWFWDQDVPTHTAGVPGGTPAVDGAHTAGDTTIAVTAGGNAGTYKKGDLVTFAGHSTQYVVTANLTLDASGEGVLSISPALSTNMAGTELITLVASHRVNLLFHPNAFAFASRMLQTGDDEGRQTVQMSDPVSGITLRLERITQYKQTLYEMDLLYGSKTIRAALATRLLSSL